MLLGLGSLIFYVVAFVYPEVHRRSDAVWAGLGLVYAAVLWFSAEQMSPLVLLGQVLAVVLLLGLGWQTLTVRRQKTPIYQQTPILLTPEVVSGWAKGKLNELRIAPDETVRSVRLERRAVEGEAPLSSRIDPRRRPAYDYEFVEDGVADVQQGELFAAFSDAGVAAVDEADEIAYDVPPSAEAEVVAVEVSALADDRAADNQPGDEATIAQDAAEVDDLAEDSTDPTSSEPKRVEIAPDTVAEAPEPEVKTVLKSTTATSNQADTALHSSTEADTLLDEESKFETDWIDNSPSVIKEPSRLPVSAREKPSLLEMPAVLVGWVKDVVLSVAKPKPSKPVIEIPRREPVAVSTEDRADLNADPAVQASEKASVANNLRYNDEPVEDDWEESNWAD